MYFYTYIVSENTHSKSLHSPKIHTCHKLLRKKETKIIETNQKRVETLTKAGVGRSVQRA